MSDRLIHITKVDEDQRLAFGFASVSVTVDGDTVTDSQGDQIDPETLEPAVYDYMLKSRDGGVMHARFCPECGAEVPPTREGVCPSCGVALKVRKAASIVESFVSTPEKLKALGLAKDAMPTGWWIGMKVADDDVWERVKSGELKAFSIGGRARRQEIAEE